MVEGQKGENYKNPDRLLSVLSFFLPFIGFIVGVIFVVRQNEIDKRTAVKCFIWSVVGLIVGTIAAVIILAETAPYGIF